MQEVRAKDPFFESKSGFFKVTLFPMETMGEGVSEGVNLLYVYILNNPGERVPSLSINLGTAQKNIERWLKELRSKGKVEFRGAPKTGGYYCKKNL